MNTYIKLFSLILAAILLCGCVRHSPSAESCATTETTQPEDTADSEAEQLYQQLFSLECKIALNLRMEESEIAKLQADYEYYSSIGSKSPIYRMADLDVTITAPDGTASTYTIEQVGVRMKGNTSRTSFYSAEEAIYNLIHLKISFQETFDNEEYYGEDALNWSDADSRKARKNRTFATLEKLDIRWNKCNDSTYIREYYAYEMFRDAGVLAPRTNLASVDWAGLHCGVFTIYEPVDKVFLERNLPSEQQGGDLYKLGWTSCGAEFTAVSSIGVEDEDTAQFYTYDLKTNKKTSTHERLTTLITALNGNLTQETLENLVDVDNFLTFAAVSYLLGNPDDLRSNYNNCYVYFPPQGGCVFIPYDYDRCLGITHEWDPTGNGVSTDDPFSLVQNATGNRQKNPLFLYTVCDGGWYQQAYAEKLQALADSKWMTEEYFLSVFQQAQSLYGGLTQPGSDFRNSRDHQTTMTTDGSDGNLTFAAYITAKKATLAQALNPTDPAPADPVTDPELYIRAEFTDWAVWEDYALTPWEDGTYRIALTGGTLKVYDQTSGRWFGAERITLATAVSYGTDGHTNIILPEGQYWLIFDPETALITIVSQ